MTVEPISPEIIKKNSNDFSFTKEVINEVNNLDYKEGALYFNEMLSDDSLADTKKSYIWSALSAVTDQVGEVLYEKVLNYIDDIADIDTCDVKSLESMAQILGTDYSVFQTLDSAPLEIQQLVNVFSIRKDYLLNSSKVCRQLAEKLSADATANLSTNSDLELRSWALSASDMNDIRPEEYFSRLSIADYIQISALDEIILSSFDSVLSSHVYAQYPTLSSDKGNCQYIYQELSNEILCSGFEIPNKYADEIYAKKLQWNIPSEFDPADELDKIEAGNAKYEDYEHYEQLLLDIELKRRSDAKYELEPRTRYTYYKEADVRDYFKFIETQYNDLLKTYENTDPYALDKSYLEISSLEKAVQLFDGSGIDNTMISTVARQLLTVTNQIRSIREYLKSHAQRTYMKGTYLLIAYVINEYLKNSIYPTLPSLGLTADYPVDSNKLTLTEYIDQTNYNNIETDIEEDRDDRTLNPPFWTGTGATGNGDSLDSTNIFRPEDKAKLVNIKSMTQEQINDFYLNVLGSFKNINQLEAAAVNSTLYSFLSTVFSTGADNSYLDEYGKVMCELPNTTQTDQVSVYLAGRKFTKDLDQYVYDVSAAYDDSWFMLSDYHPSDNITIHNQLDDALAEYHDRSMTQYSDQIQAINNYIQSLIQQMSELENIVEQYQHEFDDLTAQYSNVRSIYSTYTAGYSDPPMLTAFADLVTSFNHAVVYDLYFQDQAVKNQLILQLNSIESQHNSLKTRYELFLKSNEIIFDVSLQGKAVVHADPLSIEYNLKEDRKILWEKINPRLDFQLYLEYLLAKATELLTESQINLNTAIAEIMQSLNYAVQEFFSSSPYNTYNTLSSLLEPHYDDVFSLLSCIPELSSRLDYEHTDWYKYKVELFNKYSGLCTADTPYYYLENIKHPSYQIHPCLSNFIEYLDFSYPLQNLAGFAKDTIEYIAKNNSQLCIDSSGYLLSVWNNPLNGNSDYLSRYEKANHIDEMNEPNCLYGYDGPFYPAATTNTEIAAAVNSLTSYSTLNNSWYKGLNISEKERPGLLAKLNAHQSFIKNISQGTSSIVRYGLDVYENCYTLIEYNGMKTLWMKYKNHPYSFPAFTYNNDGSFNQNLSQISRDSRFSNEFIDTHCTMNAVGSYKFPEIEDFIFSKDRTVLLVLVKQGTTYWPIHFNIRQEYVRDDLREQYLRYFEYDRIDASLQKEHLLSASSSVWNFSTFYVRHDEVGVVYSKKASNKLSVLIDSYRRNNFNYDQTILSTGDIYLISPTQDDIKIDVQSNGDFSIAYVSEQKTENVKTYEDFTTDYSKASTMSYLTTHSSQIIAHDFQVAGSVIAEQKVRAYTPFTELGMIPVYKSTSQTNKITGTALQKDLDDGKVLKFELIGTASDYSTGIDFKSVVPLRSIENAAYQYTDTSYHRGNTGNAKRCAFNDLHYLESELNHYVMDNNDAAFWDATDTERYTYLSSTEDAATAFDEYQQLAKYEVQRYLSVMRAEDMTIETPIDSSYDVNEMRYVTEPYLISRADLISKPELTTYISGYTLSAVTGDDFLIQLDDVTISVTWRQTTVSGVKSGPIKIDFNCAYYGSQTAGTGPVAEIKQNNIRNKHHLFLNLDRPGDSGYLRLYSSTAGSPRLKYLLFIKNISDKTHPRFVMKNIDIDQTLANTTLFEVATQLKLKSSKTATKTVPVLAAEGFETKFIEFS